MKLLLLQSQVDSQKFVVYLCESVLPTLTVVPSSDENSANQQQIFKLLAEFSTHCNNIPNAENHTQAIMKRLLVSILILSNCNGLKFKKEALSLKF